MTGKILLNELIKHFKDAGFIDANSLINEAATSIPEDVIAMYNSYGLMAAVEIKTSADGMSDALIKHKEVMHEWIKEILLFLEDSRGLIVDGYLLLVLTEEPDEKLTEVIRSIESDTKVCRKHILWPKKDLNKLDRLEFVTVLSLPASPSNLSINTESFKLSPKAELLLKYYKDSNLESTIDFIKKGGLKDVN